MPLGNETALQIATGGTNWEMIIGIVAICVAVVSLWLLSRQTKLLRKQIFGEVYTKAKIKDLQFYLPAKSRHIAIGFESQQKDTEEVYFKNRKQVQVKRGVKSELHIRFFWDAPQNLRFFTCGFLDNCEKQTYSGIPVLLDYSIPFVEKEVSKLPRGVYRDWAGHWHVEFGFDRYVAENDCFVVSFVVEGSTIGKFPLHFEVGTREAKCTYTEVLWVEVVSEDEPLAERGKEAEGSTKPPQTVSQDGNKCTEMDESRLARIEKQLTRQGRFAKGTFAWVVGATLGMLGLEFVRGIPEGWNNWWTIVIVGFVFGTYSLYLAFGTRNDKG